MIKSVINTFEGGLNKDIADRLLPANKYRDALNYRLVTTKGSTTGNFENIKGNKFILDTVDVDQIVDGNIIGGVELRDEIILFVAKDTVSDPDISGGAGSKIYRLKIDLTTETQWSLELLYDDFLNIDDTHLLNLSTYYPIKAIAKYETPNVQKVYWTDGYNNIRYANFASNLTIDGTAHVDPNHDFMSVDKFEYLPKFTFSKPTLKNIVGGKVNTGMIAYAYQLYIMNGAETAFSALSDPIPVVSDNDFLSNTLSYKGDKEIVNSGKGFTMEIDNTLNTGYNRLRLVRVEYSYLNSVPAIYICNEISISPNGGILQVTDIGDVLGTLTVDEFNLVSTELFTCQDIASKDNRLFVANIEEKPFTVDTWDARAVRFRSDIIAPLYDSEQGYVTLHGLTDWANYTIDHDGINGFNNPVHDGLSAFQFMYQVDGATLGAEGPNIKIGFETAAFTLDTSNDNTTFYATTPTDSIDLSYKNYASPWKGGKLSWQRDEVYRLFVVFGNDRGQVADPKWICDLRMPSLHDDNYSSLAQLSGVNVVSTRLYPTVYFKSFPTNATWAQIHRVKRERPDRSVVTQALCVPTAVYGSSHCPTLMETPNLSTDGVELIKLVSPEININKNITKQANDYLEYVTYYIPDNVALTTSSVPWEKKRVHKLLENTKVVYSSDTKTDINDAIVVSPLASISGSNFSLVDGKSYYNYNGNVNTAKGSTGLLISYDNASWAPEGVAYTVVNYKSNVYGSQYGGSTYEDRMNNASIPCSDVISSINTLHDIPYGDTYINYFDVSTLLYDLTQPRWDWSLSESVYVPLESSINCDLQSGTSLQHITYNIPHSSLRQEYAGTQVFVDSETLPGDVTLTYVQAKDLYSYNTVYSQQIDVKPAISLVVDKILETKFDTMIKSSNKKSNGEITDSWTKFGVNEFIEVDSIYGPVNSIFNFNNKLFYFQDKGIGVLSINDRSVVQDTTSAKIVLGIGGILDRYDYISILCGSKDKFSIVGGDTGLFWFDRVNNYIIKYSDSIDKVSLSKGMQSYFTDTVSADHIVIAHPDKNNNEILYTFYINGDEGLGPTDNSFTLAYSENVDTFISFYSDIPSIYLPYKNRYLTADTVHLDYLFLHDSNIGPRCNFYSLPGGTQYYYPSTVKLLFNQDYPSTKVFDNISYISNVYNTSDTDLYNQTISSVRCYNDYQNTDYINLIYGTNLMHRDRSWTFDVPRNVVSDVITSDPNIFSSDLTNTDRLFRERMRDKYMIVDLVYNNTVLKDKFVIGNIACKYRLNYR